MTDADAHSTSVVLPCQSRGRRWWTGWAFWSVLLIAGLLLITGALLLPTFRRLQAFQYLDRHGSRYELTDRNEWLTDLLGEHAKGFREVSVISMDPVSVTDETLIQLSEFEELPYLIWRQNGNPMSVSAQGVEALRRLDQLETILLKGPGFSDEFMSDWLSARPPLRRVDLALADLSRETLYELSQIPTLSRLCITHCTIADEVFEGLPPATALTELILGGTQVGDSCAEWISQSHSLTGLHLGGTLVSDKGLVHLGKLPHLEVLQLSHCPNVSPEGLRHLQNLRDLQQLSLPATAVSASSIETLRLLPRLRTIGVSGTISDSSLQEILERHWEFVPR